MINVRILDNIKNKINKFLEKRSLLKMNNEYINYFQSHNIEYTVDNGVAKITKDIEVQDNSNSLEQAYRNCDRRIYYDEINDYRWSNTLFWNNSSSSSNRRL